MSGLAWVMLAFMSGQLVSPGYTRETEMPAAVRQVIPDDCVHYRLNPSGRLAFRVWPLPPASDGHRIWLLLCTVTPANTTQVVVWGDRTGHTALLMFRRWDQDVWSLTPYLFDVTYDERTGVLTSLYREDALGDCGTWTVWRADWGHFIMRSLEAKTVCDGHEGPYRLIYSSEGDHPS